MSFSLAEHLLELTAMSDLCFVGFDEEAKLAPKDTVAQPPRGGQIRPDEGKKPVRVLLPVVGHTVVVIRHLVAR